MMRWLLAGVALGFFTAEAPAGVLTCDFTEPFFTITFNSTTGIVTRVSADETDPDTGKPIRKCSPGMPGSSFWIMYRPARNSGS